MAFVLALAAAVTPRAEAQTFSVIHNFTGGNDGGNPPAGFTIDAAEISTAPPTLEGLTALERFSK